MCLEYMESRCNEILLCNIVHCTKRHHYGIVCNTDSRNNRDVLGTNIIYITRVILNIKGQTCHNIIIKREMK